MAQRSDKTPKQTQIVGLEPLISDEAALRTALRDRKSDYVYDSVHPADLEKRQADGWELERMGKGAARIRRHKDGDKKLEDRFWCLMARMGYPFLNGSNFNIRYDRENGSVGKKQVDVFAKDDETVVIAECKRRETRGRRALQKDLHETQNLQRPFANAVRRHFGQDFKPKILWFYVTENIIWSESDVERADAANIRIISENELQYFEAYVSHVGTAGRYQFLAEYLSGQTIPELSGLKVPATRGYLGGDKFYAFTLSARILLKLAFVNHQALNHPDSRPAYQRMISKTRLQNIGRFIESGGYFPTNILVNFDSECQFDFLGQQGVDDGTKLGLLHLPNRYKSAWIIDGQHRLFGFTNLPAKMLELPLFVVAFEKLPAKKEADLFITINHEQKSVPKGLLVALQADLKLGSDDPRQALAALASAVVRAISNDNTSPLYRRFATPGVNPTESQNLTLAEAVKGLTQSSLLGRIIGRKNRLPGYLSASTDEATIDRARRILNGYFKVIMEAHPGRWNLGREAYICVNPGVRAQLRLLNELLHILEAKGLLDPYTSEPEEVVRQITGSLQPLTHWIEKASDQDVASRFSRKFGEGGVTEYYFSLCDILSKKHEGIGGVDFQQYRDRKADQRVRIADEHVNDLQLVISKVVIETLKRVHGSHELDSGEKAYWELGIEDAGIKQAAYRKQQETPIANRAAKEAYLDLIDFEKIIRQKSNWDHLSSIFSIPLKGVNPKSKTYHLDWLQELNQIRRVAAHKSAYRQYKEEDYAFVDWLKQEIYERCRTQGLELSGSDLE
jgi:DGQHR domain-containing protein